jgi:hypothetical protein
VRTYLVKSEEAVAIYQRVIPTCEPMGMELVYEDLIHYWAVYERPTGFIRICKEVHPLDDEFQSRLTMRIEEEPSEEEAHEWLETTKGWPGVVPLSIPWNPPSNLNVDEYVARERNIFTKVSDFPRAGLVSEYIATVRVDKVIFEIIFTKLASNDPYLGRLPDGVMNTMLHRWESNQR